MPLLEVEGTTLDVPRNLALLDANVLVAFMHRRDQNHEWAKEVLAEGNYHWLVLPPVVVEACGMLVRRTKDHQTALGLLGWLLTSGDARLLPDPHHPVETELILSGHVKWMQKYEIDFVDAYLMKAAHYLTETCRLNPHTPVATFDTSDFLKCVRSGYRYSIIDMRTLDILEFR